MTIITYFGQLCDGSADFNEMLPAHSIEALDHYFMKGWEPGGFLSALIVQDYETALNCADQANKSRFWYIAQWLNTFAPQNSVGSHQQMKDWCADKNGIRSKYVDQAEKDFEWRTLSGEVQA